MNRPEELRMTKQRRTVIELLEKTSSPMTAEDIYKRAEKVNLSTIYRTLSTLSDMGIVLKNASQDGKAYYQLNSPRHGHYLKCSICKRAVLIDACPIEQMAKQLEQKTGYQITGHNLEFIGICPSCIKKKEEEQHE